MRQTNLTKDWTWTEEIWNDATEDYDEVERFAEVEIAVENVGDSRANYWCAGEPGYCEVEIIDSYGDEIPDYIEEEIIDWACEQV